MSLLDPSLKNFLQGVDQFTPAGLSGLLHYAKLTNQLGERLARGEIDPTDLKTILDSTSDLEASSVPWDVDPQAFMQGVWDNVLGAGKVTVPAVPKLRGKTRTAMLRFNMKLFYLPAIAVEEYPAGFVKTDFTSADFKVELCQRFPLPGRWVAVEMIKLRGRMRGEVDSVLFEVEKVNTIWGREGGWDHLQSWGLFVKVANALGLPGKALRVPTLEEWNLLGNLFCWINRDRAEDDVLEFGNDLEWVQNSYGDDRHVVVSGKPDNLGLVAQRKSNGHGKGPSFRFLAVL